MPALRSARDRRHGAALLWTLAVLLLVLTATVSVAQLAATAAGRRQLDNGERLAAVLLPGAEQAIVHWLEHESSKVLLPPDCDRPQVEVLDDWIAIGERQLRLTITAFDQCGMLPLRSVLTGSPLRLAVDDELLAVVDGSHCDEQVEDEPIGLDLFVAPFARPCVVYPRPRGNHSTDSSSQSPLTDMPAVGAFLGTHTAKTGPVNVNTAPRRMLEAALRQVGRGGLEQILDNRAAGRSSPAPEAEVRGRASDDESLPTFVSSSDLWSFRIDAKCDIRKGAGGFVGSSWWAVYRRSSSSTSPWTCVQRLAITD